MAIKHGEVAIQQIKADDDTVCIIKFLADGALAVGWDQRFIEYLCMHPDAFARIQELLEINIVLVQFNQSVDVVRRRLKAGTN